MYQFLDVFLSVFHGVFTGFNLLGWIWRKTRRLHLFTIGLTMVSWFGLGVFYGIGYCPLTDWHWQIKHRLGQTDLPYSYITYFLNRVTGMDWHPVLVDIGTVSLAFAALFLSGWLNWKDFRRS